MFSVQSQQSSQIIETILSVQLSSYCKSGEKILHFGPVVQRVCSYLRARQAELLPRLVQRVEQPLHRGGEAGRHFQDCPEEIIDELLDGSLGGEQPREEDLGDGLQDGVFETKIDK